MTAQAARAPTASTDPFAPARAKFEEIVAFLQSVEAAKLDHYQAETWVEGNGRECLRAVVQNFYDLKALNEPRLTDVADAEGIPRGSVEPHHARRLLTIFGQIVVYRLAYRRRTRPNLHPLDAALNLPEERHSLRLREIAAIEAARGSFEEAKAAITRLTGQIIGKRQVEELVRRASADVEGFYAQLPTEPVEDADVLVLSADGKGIVMRPNALRPATRKAAERSTPKLATRLSKGEKRNRKRMAEVGVVYDAVPVARTPSDILPDPATPPDRAAPAPKAKNRWFTASVVDRAADVIAKIFAQADQRDPEHQRTWVALVDGNKDQIDHLNAQAACRQLTLPILIDFIHVLEYLWKAAWSFYEEGDPQAEAWVREKALAVLQGKAPVVAAAITRKATSLHLAPDRRQGADRCATYLLNHKAYLDYPTALGRGWPIATGVVEGACRHLVKDRMDITGARWSLEGAEAMLKLRALRANGDFDAYWPYHLAQERRRVHQSRYANGRIPLAAAMPDSLCA